jgi:hypothetical protein
LGAMLDLAADEFAKTSGKAMAVAVSFGIGLLIGPARNAAAALYEALVKWLQTVMPIG